MSGSAGAVNTLNTMMSPEKRAELIQALSVPRFATAMNRSRFLQTLVKGGFAGLQKLHDSDLLICHLDAFNHEFRYEDTQVSSAQEMNQAERLLTDEQRSALVEILVDNQADYCRKDGDYLANLLREGRGGVQDMTDDALLSEHEDQLGHRYEHDPRPESPTP